MDDKKKQKLTTFSVFLNELERSKIKKFLSKKGYKKLHFVKMAVNHVINEMEKNGLDKIPK